MPCKELCVLQLLPSLFHLLLIDAFVVMLLDHSFRDIRAIRDDR